MVLNTVYAAGDELKQQVEREKNQAHWSGLPVWGEQARDLGYELPIPVGFGIYMNSQDVEYVATDDFKIDATGGLLGGRNKLITMSYQQMMYRSKGLIRVFSLDSTHGYFHS